MPPRKRATAATKKPARKPGRQATRGEQIERIEAFEEFRRRAQRSPMAGAIPRDLPPYVLGPELGFDPPVAVAFPTTALAVSDFDQAFRNGDPFGMLRVLLGSEYRRVLAMFDQQPDGFELLTGLSMAITDHFLGAGAADVPGGTRAS